MKLKIINLIEIITLISCILYTESWNVLLLVPFILLINHCVYEIVFYRKIRCRDEYKSCKEYYKSLIKFIIKWFVLETELFILIYSIICQALVLLCFHYRYHFISAAPIIVFLAADLILIANIKKYKILILALKSYIKISKNTRLYFLEISKENIDWDNTLAKDISGNRVVLEYIVDMIAHEKGWT